MKELMMMSVSPKGKQIEVLALPTHGHYVVLDKVLLVTFNKALVHYMRYIDGSDSTKLIC